MSKAKVLLLFFAYLCLVLAEGSGSAPGIDGCDTTEEEEKESKYVTKNIAIVVALASLAVTFVVGYILEKYHQVWLPEAGFAVILGAVIAAILYAIQEANDGAHVINSIQFNKEFFFVWLLPPIIFEAGYNMNKKAFFANIVPTMLYAFIGTFVSTFIVGFIIYGFGQAGISHELRLLPSLIFGALISATDPVSVLAVFSALGVNSNLFSMVFGEAVLNDAVALVLYRTLLTFKCAEFGVGSVLVAILLFLQIFVLSFVIGYGLGLLCSFTFKALDLSHNHSNLYLEASLTVAFPWGAYFLAEACGLSGIVAILFAGITMAHYTRDLLSEEALVLTKDMYKIVAKIAETFVFVYLGMSIFSFQSLSGTTQSLLLLHKTRYNLIIVAIFACLVARLFNIYPCSAIINIFRSGPPVTMKKISQPYQFLMWWSGLRGGVAFAIAVANYTDNQFPNDDEGLIILQTTLFVAVFTIFIFGGSITSLARYFKVIGEDPNEVAKFNVPDRLERIDGKMRTYFTSSSHVKLQEEK